MARSTSTSLNEALGQMFKGTPTLDPTAPAADDEQRQHLESLPYYHRRLNRVDAVFPLHQSGDFLLRKTTTVERFAVSVFWRDRVLHFPVRKLAEGYCFEAKTFPSVDELIAWHRTYSVPLTKETGAILKEPKPMAAWELLTNELVLVRKLCPGWFGDVYVGNLVLRGNGTVRPVAIKTSSPATSTKEFETVRETMLRECRILRDLCDHPNVVKCFGMTVDSIDGHVMTAVELVLGGRLDERLRGHPPLAPARKHELALAAAKAILYVHCHGYVHRNVCAKNFLVELDEKRDVRALKLSGFHFARRLDPSSDSFRVRSVDRMPTPTSSAPEALAAYLWTKRSDVWSWAVLVWEIFSNGSRPYEAEIAADKCKNANMVLQAIQNGAQLRPHADMSEALLGFWTAAMQHDAAKRPSSFKVGNQFSE